MNNALDILNRALAAAEPNPQLGFANTVAKLITALQKKHKRSSFDVSETVRASISSPRTRGPHELEDTLMLRDSESMHHAWVRVDMNKQTVVLDIDGRWYPVAAPATETAANVLRTLVSVYKASNGSLKTTDACVHAGKRS